MLLIVHKTSITNPLHEENPRQSAGEMFEEYRFALMYDVPGLLGGEPEFLTQFLEGDAIHKPAEKQLPIALRVQVFTD